MISEFFMRPASLPIEAGQGRDSRLPVGLISTTPVKLPSGNYLMVGGSPGFSASSIPLIYDVDPTTWQWRLADIQLPSANRAVCAAYANGSLVVACGYRGDTKTNEILRCDLTTKIWSTITLPVATAEAVMMWNDAKTEIHIMCGGTDASGASGVVTVHVLNTTTWTRTTGTASPVARFGQACCYEGDGWWVIFGGYGGAPTTTVYRYNANTRAYDTTVGQLPSSRYRMSCSQSVINGRIYLYGGQVSAGQTDTIWYYDVATKQIVTTTDTLQYSTYFAGVVTEGGTDYILGTNSATNRTTMKYTP